MRNSENGWSEVNGGTAQLDDHVVLVMQKLKDMGADYNTIVVFTTDNGTVVFHLARWRADTVPRRPKERSLEGGFRVPCILTLARPRAGGLRSRTASSPAWTGSPPS